MAYYALFTAVGYAFYGSCAADAVTLNFMWSSPILGKIATLGVLLNTALSYANFMSTPTKILTEVIYCGPS